MSQFTTHRLHVAIAAVARLSAFQSLTNKHSRLASTMQNRQRVLTRSTAMRRWLRSTGPIAKTRLFKRRKQPHKHPMR